MRAIQSDSGGNVSSLESDSIDHCETESLRMNMCLLLDGYRDAAVRIRRFKSIVNSNNKKREITYR